MTNKKIVKLVLAAMFVALAMVLPFVIGNIPTIGKMLSPMHIPALLCGFFCGPWYGLAVGFISPLLRGALFGMPALMPSGVPMAFELAAYGCMTGILNKVLPRKKWTIYVSLISAMLAGRLVAAVVKVILAGLGQLEYSFQIFIASSFVNAFPGIILHIVLIPIIVMAIRKAFPGFEEG